MLKMTQFGLVCIYEYTNDRREHRLNFTDDFQKFDFCGVLAIT